MIVDLDSLAAAADAGGGAVLGNGKLRAIVAELRQGRAALSELGRRAAVDSVVATLG